MDLEKILTDLKRERDRLIHVITLLSGDSAAPKKTARKHPACVTKTRRVTAIRLRVLIPTQ
jgi:hypothetical protein